MDWIAGWANRIKFEIDHTSISGNLSNFPVLVNLDTTYSGVFTELGNNSKRMSFMNPSTGEQYFCEIENWDSTNNSAQLWVKIPTISSGTNTKFYMLYDNSHADNIDYVGETLSTDWSEFGSYTTGSLVGDASIVSDYILLTPAVDSKNGHYDVTSVSRGPEFTVYFRHYAGGGDGADKINFKWGTLGVDYYEISIDEYHDVIRFYFNDAIKQETACSNIDNSTWSNVKITTHINNGNIYIKCWFRETLYIDTYITYVEFSTNFFSFYGYTGGLNNEHRIKDIQLKSHSTAARNVWDDNFIAVYHMTQNPSAEGNCMIDSTSYSRDGATQSSMTDTDLVSSKIGKGINFDGIDDYIVMNAGGGYDPGTNGFTAEALFKPFTISGSVAQSIITKGNYYSTREGWSMTQYQDDMTVRCNASGDTLERASQVNSSFFAANTWGYAALVLDRTINKILGYGDADNSGFSPGGGGPTSDDITGFDISTTDSMEIGATYDAGTPNAFVTGIVDEVRLSNVARSPAWIYTTYKSNFDDLLIKSPEEILSSGELNYQHRIKLTISGSLIDTTLYNFPVLINLSESSGITAKNLAGIFTQLENDSNRKKIAVTDYTGIAQCYVEIERWSTINKSAQLWVKVPEISSIQDTILYLYYDLNQVDNSLMVGDTNSIPAQQVWDYNFDGVWHMSQDPTGGTGCVKDSTSNGRNYTPQGSMTNGDLVDGKIGKALDFDGSNDYLRGGDWFYSNILTVEATFKTDVLAGEKNLMLKRNIGTTGGSANEWVLSIAPGSGGSGAGFVAWGSGGVSFNAHSTSLILSASIFYYVAGRCDGSNAVVFLNDEKGAAYTQDYVIQDTTNEIEVGALSASTPSRYFDGLIDEVRISNIARSDAWIKATYYSNTDSLLTFSNSYYFSGYVYEQGIPVSRSIYLYYKENGNFIASTTSSGNGYYYLETTYSGAHYLVCVDDLAGVDYNDLIVGNVFPTVISV